MDADPTDGELEALQALWDALGRVDPLWAVLSNEGQRAGQWGPSDFFANGSAHADFVMELLADADAVPALGRCLDFGCGPGRVTQGLCRHFDHVEGIDIAPSMIELARRYNQFGDRCRYHVNARSELSMFEDASFDCVHSVVVLQHIDPPHALSYAREFLRVLAAGGIAVFQAPSHRREPAPAVPMADGAFRAQLRFAGEPPHTVAAGEQFSVAVAVRNDGDAWWSSPARRGPSSSSATSYPGSRAPVTSASASSRSALAPASPPTSSGCEFRTSRPWRSIPGSPHNSAHGSPSRSASSTRPSTRPTITSASSRGSPSAPSFELGEGLLDELDCGLVTGRDAERVLHHQDL